MIERKPLRQLSVFAFYYYKPQYRKLKIKEHEEIQKLCVNQFQYYMQYDFIIDMTFVTIHHETNVKSPLGHVQFMLYLESTCPKL